MTVRALYYLNNLKDKALTVHAYHCSITVYGNLGVSPKLSITIRQMF